MKRPNNEIAAILGRAKMTHAQAATYLSKRLGREVKAYHIGRAIAGERRPPIDEMDGLRALDTSENNKFSSVSGHVDAIALTETGDVVSLFSADIGGKTPLRLREEQRIGTVPIHPAQRGSKSAFAFVMADTTLGDRIGQGEIGYAVRSYPPVSGKPCLVEREDGDVLVAIYEGRDANTLFVAQLTPPKKISVPLRDVAAVHAVVGVTFAGR